MRRQSAGRPNGMNVVVSLLPHRHLFALFVHSSPFYCPTAIPQRCERRAFNVRNMKRSRPSSRYQLRARAAKKPLPIIEQDTASEGSLSEAEKLINDELFIPDQITAISDESEPADTVDLDVPYEPHSDDAA
eukprot:IDg13921t1